MNNEVEGAEEYLKEKKWAPVEWWTDEDIKKAYSAGYNAGRKEKNEDLQKSYDELNDFKNSQCAKLLMRNQILERAIGENMIHAVDMLEELRNQLSEIKKTFRGFEDAVADDNKSEELWQKLKILLS